MFINCLHSVRFICIFLCSVGRTEGDAQSSQISSYNTLIFKVFFRSESLKFIGFSSSSTI